MAAHASFFDLTWTGTISNDLELGQRHTFSVKDYTDQLNPTAKNSAKCDAILTLNKSSGTLAKGLRCLPTTNTSYVPPFSVLGAAGAEATFAGVVSPFITSTTVADGAAFWLIVAGMTKMGYNGSANFTCGDDLATAASGWIAEWTDYTNIFVGYAAETKTSGSAGDLMWVNLTCNTCYR